MYDKGCVIDLLSADISFLDLEIELFYVYQNYNVNFTIKIDKSLY